MSPAASVLAQAERIETLAAEIYLALSRQFAGHAESAQLFGRLAAEELQHASRVRMLGQMSMKDARSFSSSRPAAEALDRVVREAETVLAAVKQGSVGSAPEARRLMMRLEENLAVAHADHLAVGAAPGIADFFRKMAEQDRAHRALLAAGLPPG